MILNPSNVGWPCCNFLELSAAYRFATDPTKGDDSKNSYDLTVAGGPSWDAGGKNNGCLQFTGSSDKVSNGALLDSTDFSACGWFKCDSVLSNGDKVYPFLVDDSSLPGNDTGIAFVHDGSLNPTYAAHAMFEGVDQGDMFGGTTFDLSDWVWWALLIDVDGFSQLRVNSQARVNMHVSAGLNHTDAQTFRCQPAEDGHTMIGEIDEVYIQKGKLWDTNTLNALYNSGDGKFVDENGDI